MDFKVGDKVKFIGDITKHHCFEKKIAEDIKKYNNVFTIACIVGEFVEFKENSSWYIKKEEIELIQEKQFTKADLKNGDIVTYKKGDKKRVVSNVLLINDDDGYINGTLDNYTDDLKDTMFNTELDIVRVERPIKYETIFEREEKILNDAEKKYLSNIIRPFKNEVKKIIKRDFVILKDTEYISIHLKEDRICLPTFEKGSMYKGMKSETGYTLEELGI